MRSVNDSITTAVVNQKSIDTFTLLELATMIGSNDDNQHFVVVAQWTLLKPVDPGLIPVIGYFYQVFTHR